MNRLLFPTLPTLMALMLTLAPACSNCGDPVHDIQTAPDSVAPDSVAPETGDLSGEDIAIGDYPPSPYGKKAGTIIKDLSFFDPEAGANISFSDLRNAGEKKLLFVTAGAGWCSACKQEAVELKAKYLEYGPLGLEIWSTLFQDYVGNPADEVFWNKWKAQLTPNYPLLLDTDFVLSSYFNPESAPLNILIRLDTMEILYLETGFDPASVEAEIKKFLE